MEAAETMVSGESEAAVYAEGARPHVHASAGAENRGGGGGTGLIFFIGGIMGRMGIMGRNGNYGKEWERTGKNGKELDKTGKRAFGVS